LNLAASSSAVPATVFTGPNIRRSKGWEYPYNNYESIVLPINDDGW
jgi:hypothetical protein